MKKTSIVLLSFFLLLPSINAQTISCRQAFSNAEYIKIETQGIKSRSLALGFGVVGLTVSIAATAVTFGAATPIAIYTGFASLGLMSSGVGYETYKITPDAKKYLSDRRVHGLLNSAESFLENKEKGESQLFINFYKKQFQKEDADPKEKPLIWTWEKIESIYSSQLPEFCDDKCVAMSLVRMDKRNNGLCVIKDLTEVDGNKYFSYLSEDEILKNIINQTNKNSN